VNELPKKKRREETTKQIKENEGEKLQQQTNQSCAENVQVQENPSVNGMDGGTADIGDASNRFDEKLFEDETPDMQFKENQQAENQNSSADSSQAQIIQNCNLGSNDGLAPPSVEEGMENISSEPQGHLNNDGSADGTDTTNRVVRELNEDGTPDMRFHCNKG